MTDADRTTQTATPPAKVQPPAVSTPAVSTPVVSTPAVSTPAVTAPSPAAKVAAIQPAPKAIAIDLSKFTGPTDNADLFGYDDNEGRLFLLTSGTIVLPLNVSADGDYEVVIKGACDEADGQKAIFTVALDGQAVGGEIKCIVVESKEYVVKVTGLKAGDHKIDITFLNDVYKENEYDLNFYVHGVTLRPAK